MYIHICRSFDLSCWWLALCCTELGPGHDDYIPRSLALLRKGGRFIEIGKRGIWTHEQSLGFDWFRVWGLCSKIGGPQYGAAKHYNPYYGDPPKVPPNFGTSPIAEVVMLKPGQTSRRELFAKPRMFQARGSAEETHVCGLSVLM